LRRNACRFASEPVAISAEYAPKASKKEKASIRQGLAKVLFDLGEYREAILTFKAALSDLSWEESFYGDMLLWLASCYAAVGEYQEASSCYRTVLTSRFASKKDQQSAQEYLAQLPPPFGVKVQ
jgi:tetratricopeptide (TPR) repeat protein